MRNSSGYPTPSPGIPVAEAKARRRQRIRERRRRRSVSEIELAGRRIAAHLEPLLDGVTIVAAFASTPFEPDTGPLLAALARHGCEIRLPLFDGGFARTWGRYHPGDPLSPATLGRPPLPRGPILPEESIAEAGLILAPALAVDTHGTRLGQGGGWYDRALTMKSPGTPAYGVVFSEEFTAVRLPASPHDLPLDGVLTPDGFTPLPIHA